MRLAALSARRLLALRRVPRVARLAPGASPSHLPLALGAAVATGQELRLAQPLAVADPLALPLGDVLAGGGGPVTVVGAAGGQVLTTAGRAAPVIHEPTLSAGNGSIRLSPFLLQTSSVESVERATVLAYGLEGHRRAQAVMEQTLDLLATNAPDAHRQVVAVIDTIALQDPEVGERRQASLSDLPGTFAMSCSPSPYVNCDSIVHEYFHNRLFALEELGRIFERDEDEAGSGPALFSPWAIPGRSASPSEHPAEGALPQHLRSGPWLDTDRERSTPPSSPMPASRWPSSLASW